MTKPKTEVNKIIPIKEIVNEAPITTSIIRPLQPDHYLLQSLIPLWRAGKITSDQFSDAYFNVDKASALLSADHV